MNNTIIKCQNVSLVGPACSQLDFFLASHKKTVKPKKAFKKSP